ncbi:MULTISPECIES: N-acetylmuramoyl-L-alanine amidase [unclassified Bradyrhizobium]|uniref:N-acetylmuramoyl-L-alanine amidase family protein n=2 Tax=Bradyrhizobium TaxID=374 RepID=UPI0024E1194E|nr:MULTISPECIES: N-acetylmuramoyl-L-alanine amidase [unclassified Bradyrhizobium]
MDHPFLNERTIDSVEAHMRVIQWALVFPLMIPLLLSPCQVVLAASCSSRATEDIVIAIDVGHIARQPLQQCQRGKVCSWGETSARGVPEYDFNIKLATRVSDELISEGFRSTRLLIPRVGTTLAQRADLANAMNANVFISVHHDGINDDYLNKWTYGGQTLYFFDQSNGFSLHVAPSNPKYLESLELARLIADQLIEKGLNFNRIHEAWKPWGARKPYADSTRGIYKRDDLALLRALKMPAVLLEGGVIVNRDEELLIATPAYQVNIASAVANAITEFCRPRKTL